MFTLLADSMFTAALNRRGSDIPENHKGHADRYISHHERRQIQRPHSHNPYRDLW